MEAVSLCRAGIQNFAERPTFLHQCNRAEHLSTQPLVCQPATLSKWSSQGWAGKNLRSNRWQLRKAAEVGSGQQLLTKRRRGLAVGIPRASGSDIAENVKAAVSDGADDLGDEAAAAATAIMDSIVDAADTVEARVAPEYAAWNSLTEKLTLGSSFAGLFLMAPQIVKNAELLASGQGAALGILSWLGFSMGFLGNMLLLSYFASKRELSATLVQAVGATSTCVLLSQIYLAGFMPPAAFAAAASFLAVGLAVNALRYLRSLPSAAWAVWEDLTGILGLAVLPQVACQTAFPGVQTVVPGGAAALAAALFVALLRSGRVPEEWRGRWAQLSGWTATLLFMCMPVAQLKECLLRPESLAGLSPLSPVMGVVSNGLMIPRALFIRDFMWFTGASWGALVGGWAILLTMALHQAVGQRLFFSVTGMLLAYLSTILVRDSRAHRLPSALASLKSLWRGGL